MKKNKILLIGVLISSSMLIGAGFRGKLDTTTINSSEFYEEDIWEIEEIDIANNIDIDKKIQEEIEHIDEEEIDVYTKEDMEFKLIIIYNKVEYIYEEVLLINNNSKEINIIHYTKNK